MEDILASIRRIIAEDQSNSLGRNGLGGLTRRQPPAPPAPVVDEAAPAEPLDHTPLAQVSEEPEAHAGPQVDLLHHTYAEPVEAVQEPEPDASAPLAAAVFHTMEPYPGDTAYGMQDHAVSDPHHPADLTTAAEDAEPLMSPMAGASITSSFQTLAESVVLQDPGLIERVMRESMRPLLKAWLDDHLPSIVERLVRTEIERVARGGRPRNA